MKKFLTVLLALSVVFTYSFSAVGSVFAAVNTENQAKYEVLVESAADQVSALITTAYKEAVKNLPDEDPGLAVAADVDAEIWKANASIYEAKIKDMIADKTADIKGAYKEATSADLDQWDLQDAVDAFGKATGDYVDGGSNAPVAKAAVPTTVNGVIAAIQADADVKLAVAKAYGESLADDAIVALKSIDTTIYSDTVNATTKMSSAAMADALVKYYISEIEKLDFAGAEAITDVDTALSKLGTFGTATLNVVTDEITNEAEGSEFLRDFLKATDDIFNKVKYVIKSDATYNGQPLVTKDDEAADAKDFEALKASYLAKVQAVYAEFIKTGDAAEAAAYKDGVSEIINATKTTDELKAIFTNEAAIATETPTENSAYAADKEAIDDLVVFANKYIAEGYDADEINDIIAGAKVQAYKAAVVWDKTWKKDDPQTAEDAIKAALAAQFDTKIIDKEVADLETALGALLAVTGDTGYYAPEAEKVKALYNAIIAEVKACTNQADLDKVNTKYALNPEQAAYSNPTGLSAIAPKSKVKNAIKKTLTGDTGWTNNKSIISIYGQSLNTGVAADNRRDFVKAGMFDDANTVSDSWLVDFYAEKGARTTAEAYAMIPDAKAALDAVKTVGAVKAVATAIEAQIAALPAATAITAADAAAVEAAKDAYDEFVAETGYDISASAKLTLTKALTAAGNATKLALLKEVNSYAGKDVTAADKEALETLLDKIGEYNEKIDNNVYTTGKITTEEATVKTYLATIRNAAKKAVEKAIAALPLTVTKDNLNLVEAAQKLYDEYVATYTDFYTALAKVYNPTAGFNQDAAKDINASDLKTAAKAADKIKAEIAAQEKAEQIKAVESFKIKVTTKRYTGSKMRVNWTVVSGDESAIDGYRVYYSTKKSNSGYKYLTKTTKKYINHTSIKKSVKKGTRVYYRVRAYKEIDGVRYFSDYSTVGNRIWK